MPMREDTLREEFASLFQEVLQRKIGPDPAVGMKNLAERIGVHYQTFIRWPKGTRPIHADKLALLCKELDDTSLLNWLERQLGRVAYVPIAAGDRGKARRALEIAGFIKKVGEALRTLGEGLESGRAERDKMQETLSSLDDLIRECMRLKVWVNEQLRATR
jgi:transcriptional regulator with XRE-family HTH domain